MENQTTAFQKTIDISKNNKTLFLMWAFVMSFLYCEHIGNYEKSIIERYCIRDLYGFFDYTDDYEREKECMDYAKKNGHYQEAQCLKELGFRFLKPLPNIWKFLSLITLPLLCLLIAFQIQISFRRIMR